jgi:hypothetical protein
VPVAKIVALPLSLIEAFLSQGQGDVHQGWRKLLLFLSPITITGGLKIKVSR